MAKVLMGFLVGAAVGAGAAVLCLKHSDPREPSVWIALDAQSVLKLAHESAHESLSTREAEKEAAERGKE